MLLASGAAVTGGYLLKIPVIASALSNAGLGGQALIAGLGAAVREVAAFADNGVTISFKRVWVGLNPTLLVRGVYQQP